MKNVDISSSLSVPALGQGTWNMGDKPAKRAEEIATLQRGVELGLTVIDTAELYGSGRSELLVGEALRSLRDDVFLVSKVLPYNASFEGTLDACEQSLMRLGTDRLDLFLLHWPGSHPLDETISAFERLKSDGKILNWGVSNFDPAEMAQLSQTPGGEKVACNQILYNLTRRGVEWDLLPDSAPDGPAIMAYSPIEQARLLHDNELQKLAKEAGLTPAQLALAWVLRQINMIAIPKASTIAHVEDNAQAANVSLSDDILAELDRLYPPPSGPMPLEVI